MEIARQVNNDGQLGQQNKYDVKALEQKLLCIKTTIAKLLVFKYTNSQVKYVRTLSGAYLNIDLPLYLLYTFRLSIFESSNICEQI